MRELELAIFAGTTEGRQLSEVLARAQIKHTICVATEYGETVLKPHPFVKVHQGRIVPSFSLHEEQRVYFW